MSCRFVYLITTHINVYQLQYSLNNCISVENCTPTICKSICISYEWKWFRKLYNTNKLFTHVNMYVFVKQSQNKQSQNTT